MGLLITTAFHVLENAIRGKKILIERTCRGAPAAGATSVGVSLAKVVAESLEATAENMHGADASAAACPTAPASESSEISSFSTAFESASGVRVSRTLWAFWAAVRE